jgi:hypothetical protein
MSDSAQRSSVMRLLEIGPSYCERSRLDFSQPAVKCSPHTDPWVTAIIRHDDNWPPAKGRCLERFLADYYASRSAHHRHRHQTLAVAVLFDQRFNLGRHCRDTIIQSAPVLDEVSNEANQPWRESRCARTQDVRQRLAQGCRPLPECDAALDEKASDLIDHSRAQSDEPRAHPMQSQ